MISLIDPSEYAVLRDAPDLTAMVMKAHMQFTEARLMDALIARFGELPPPEEIRKHCMKVIDSENVAHYCWFDVKPELGETVDLSNVLVSIAPPAIFEPKPEN